MLWIPAERTAVIADAHLGYSWAQRRRGELGPIADSRALAKLRAVRDQLAPARFLFLGDLVHAPRPCAPEREWIESTLLELARDAEVIAVRGNHDRAFARDFGHLPIHHCQTWTNGHITAAHGDKLAFAWPEGETVLLGHLHPVISVQDASGAAHKLPAFLVGTRCILLPAFSPFARGYDVGSGLPAELANCFNGSEIQVFAASGKRVAALGTLQRALEIVWAENANAAFRFRRPGPKRSA
ncbi:MAG: metallophosphoesterase [Acidobacteriaceae bacterium]|nr:metallophosphoesterase [Acidobacteriaceae bacterium]